MPLRGFDILVAVAETVDEMLLASAVPLEAALSAPLVGVALGVVASDSAESVGMVGRSGTSLSEAVATVGRSEPTLSEAGKGDAKWKTLL